MTAFGVLIASRPLSSLTLLGILIGAACIVTGIGELLQRRRAWLAALWVGAGLAILVWLGRSIELLPLAVGVLLLASGLLRLVTGFGGRREISARVLTIALGLAELAFGAFALTWPDITLIAVAVLFGIRTIGFGLSLLWHGQFHWPPSLIVAGRWVAAVLVLALAAGSIWLSHTLRRGAPVLDDFYTAPSVIPAQPGTLVRAEPYAGDVPEGMSAWRILYSTTTLTGSPGLASGVVAVPRDVAAAPVIAWNHGTVGIARACAPSLTPGVFSAHAVPAVDAIVRNGWAVVATDYTGMGAPGRVPFLIGEGEARSTLDAVRAARRLPSAALSQDTVIWGHSQGGHAALWTAQIAPEYAPDVRILGTAALAPAGDLPALGSDLAAKGPIGAILAAYVLSAYDTNYRDVNLDEYVSTSGRTFVREIAARCPTAANGARRPETLVSVLDLIAVSRDRPLFDFDLTTGALSDRLSQNVPTGPFPQPLFIGWGTSDEVIAPAVQDKYVAGLCRSGQSFEYRSYPGKTHLSVLAADSALPGDLEQWTRARLNHQPPTDSC